MIYKRDICLEIQNRKGSVEHYYHFFLGFLIPLTLFMDKCQELSFTPSVYVRSCGPLDRVLIELGFPNLFIISRSEHLEMMGRSALAQFKISGYDGWGNFCRDEVSLGISLLRARLRERIIEATDQLHDMCSGQKITLINRGETPSYYLSHHAEVQNSASGRRSIPNFGELESIVFDEFRGAVSFSLEEVDLAFQIALFSWADCIVAQHGAALANVVFCKPNTQVIEIQPISLGGKPTRKLLFSELAHLCGLDYLRIDQEGIHSDVDAEAVRQAISQRFQRDNPG